MQPSAVGEKLGHVRPDRQCRIERGFRRLEVPQLELSKPVADHGFEVMRLKRKRPLIACDGQVISLDRHFGHESVAAILRSLEAEDRPELRAWAGQTLGLLRSRSPTMLMVTLEQLRRGKALALAECFRMELGLVHGCFEQGDFLEGIRAVLVDKDNRPRWNPPELAEVDPETIRRFFAPRWEPRAHPLANLP